MAQVSELEHAIGYSTTESSSLFYHPNSRDFLYVSGGNLVICDFTDPHKQSFLRGHDDDITTVALSPCGGFVATGQSGENSDIVLWDFDSRTMLRRFSEHDYGIKTLAFSTDSKLLLSVGDDNKMYVWDVFRGMIVSCTYVPQGAKVLAAAWGGFVKDVKRRDTECYQFAIGGNGLWVCSLDPYKGSVDTAKVDTSRFNRNYLCLGFTEIVTTSGKTGQRTSVLLAGTSSGDFLTFTVRPNRDRLDGAPTVSVMSATSACGGGVCSMSVMPRMPQRDGYGDLEEPSKILIGGGDGHVEVYAWDMGLEKWVDSNGANFIGKVKGLSVGPDGTEMLAGTSQGYIYRARCDRLDQFITLSVNHCGPVYAVAYAPDSSTKFATCGADGTVRVWDANDYSVKAMATVSGLAPGVEPRVDAVISGWTDGKVRCHDAKTAEELWTIDDAHCGGVTALALSGNMRFVVTGGEKGEVRVWELRNRDLVSHLKEHTKRVTSVSVFEDDVHAMSCSRDRSFLCWDLRNEKRISSHCQAMGGINSIALTHDQTLVVTVGQERSVTFWDLRQHSHVAKVADPAHGMHTLEATCICMSNGNSATRLFATGGSDKIVKLWTTGIPEGSGDDPAPALMSSNPGHSGVVNGTCFSPDDRQLVSVGTDGAIFIWNIYAEDEKEQDGRYEQEEKLANR